MPPSTSHGVEDGAGPIARASQWVRSCARDHRRFAWLIAALAATAVGVGAAVIVKAPCLDHDWGDNFAFKQRCYNDIQPLYGPRHFADHVIPYVDYHPPTGDARMEDQPGFNEYPVLTGMTQYLTSLVTTGSGPFFTVTAILLGLCAFATTLALAFGELRPSRLVAWSLVPPLALYAFNNWDLLAVALATAGLVAYSRDRNGWAGSLVALGACAKLYPLLFLPLLGIDLLRRERGLRRRGWRFGLGAVGALVAVNAPVMAMNLDGWLATYQFHLARAPSFEALWSVLGHMDPSRAEWYHMANPILLVALLGLGTLVALGRLRVGHACLSILALFVLFNVVQSVQYAIWLVPMLALVRMPWWVMLLFFVGDVMAFIAVWDFFASNATAWDALTTAVLVRAAGQALLAGAAIWFGWRNAQADRDADPLAVSRDRPLFGAPVQHGPLL